MRPLFLAAIIVLLGLPAAALSQTAPYHAGIMRSPVAVAAPFEMLVWYPSDAAEVPWQVGPFVIPASRDVSIASGRFSVVLLSHGGGLTGGTPLLLRELSAALARQGFIVVAPFHGKTGLRARTFQVSQALDAALADARFASHADAARIGMIGFSLGTAVTLEVAGGIPNAARLVTYCGAHPDDAMSCDHAPDGNNGPALEQAVPVRLAPLPKLALKAIVLLDPFGALFGHDELSAVTMPVLLFRPDRSELPGAPNGLGIADALPRPPQIEMVPGRHFIFADVCPPDLRSAAPAVCEDPPGVDRPTVHTDVEARIARFLRNNL